MNKFRELGLLEMAYLRDRSMRRRGVAAALARVICRPG